MTPKGRSSGQRRQLGRISKQGDRYLRMLLAHGARSVLRAVAAAQHAAFDEAKPNSRLTRKKTERLSFEMPSGALPA